MLEGLIHLSLHKHHPCSLSSKSFAGVERRIVATRLIEVVLYIFFAAHEGNLFFLKACILIVEAGIDRIDILKDLFVVNGLGRQESVKFVPF